MIEDLKNSMMNCARIKMSKNGLSENPSITMSFLKTHIDEPWEWGHGGFSTNQFEKHEFIKMKHEKEKKLRRGLNKLNDLVFFKYTGNPYHSIGRRRIEKQYDELMKNVPYKIK